MAAVRAAAEDRSGARPWRYGRRSGPSARRAKRPASSAGASCEGGEGLASDVPTAAQDLSTSEDEEEGNIEEVVEGPEGREAEERDHGVNLQVDDDDKGSVNGRVHVEDEDEDSVSGRGDRERSRGGNAMV